MNIKCTCHGRDLKHPRGELLALLTLVLNEARGAETEEDEDEDAATYWPPADAPGRANTGERR